MNALIQAWRTRRGDQPGDQGLMTVELAILVPVAVGLLMAIGACGLVATAHQAVQAAAAQGARAASISRTQDSAAVAANQAAAATLSDENLKCASTTVDVDTSGFAVPVGRPASVAATVTCQLNLGAQLGLPAVPAALSITATVHSPLDTYRER